MLFTSATMRRHPFFVSMTEIEWKPAEKKFEIAVRIFTDDLEKALAADCRCKTDLASNANEAVMNKLLADYIVRHLRISKGKESAKLIFLGREKEDESTWSYFEASCDYSGAMEVENKLLYSTQEKQVNLIRFRKPGSDNTIQLKNPESRAFFD
jgi:hypothetical protein